ncbi:non-ribosomal peptide synthetase [Microlunatus soli]|uniref:Amino acid adenylation domain-containing protein n=1 Tax=Microlunatus soli TaxID=630515 RepID=A0A1H1VTQ6_9ACTN|nr:non-ribosomal peptide synthetase [Microlunatus soli]SDS88294.1 amino acid adenylation domain-containing protein [Microlunatus soli]
MITYGTLPDLFGNAVAQHPDRIALVTPTEQLDYATLADRVNRAARKLMMSGIGPEDVVAVLVRRDSASWLTTALGIVTAGAGYLCLDPDYPADRLAFMIDDARPKMIIGDRDRDGRFDLPFLSWHDLDAGTVPGHPITDADRRAPLRVDNLLYLIYTSGSTGTPKGVAVTHRGLVGLVASQSRVIGTGPGDAVLQWASPSFDAAFWDVSLALLHGATLHLAGSADLMPGEPLADLIAARGISHATIPPVALNALPTGVERTRVRGVGTIITTGDTCTAGLVRRWAPGRRLINGYGPTETTVGASLSTPLAVRNAIDIGRPFDRTRIDVLDDQLRDVGTGRSGQLVIGGPGVARGYVGRPALTADRFRPDPCGPAGSRRYLSGDLGRRDEDGRYHFGGRRDGQIKFRGFRIELGEIEAVLAEHPAVTGAVVVVGAGSDGPALNSYLTVDRRVEADPVREFAGRRLPAHMVPSTFTVLDTFPRSPNGKLDRSALPEPDRPGLGTTPPADGDTERTDTEQYVCDLFGELLRHPTVDPDDDFFDIGGHSILLTRLVSRIKAERAPELSLRTAFASRTARRLAIAIDQCSGPADPADQRLNRTGNEL